MCETGGHGTAPRRSSSAVLQALHRARERGSRIAQHSSRHTRLLYELFVFAIKQAWACMFGALLLALLLATHRWYPPQAALARYDLLVVAALAIQILLLWSGMELWEEAKVIFLFHLVGTIMEVFKTSMGSWTYTEASVLRIGAVPLFSGFMYASVGSYLARIWRLFDFRFSYYPRRRITALLALLVYVNFFSHHFMPDLRWLLIAAIVALYGPCTVYFRVDKKRRSMPLLLGFFLVSLFIWIAENVATFAHAWTYPSQREQWTMVGWSKLGSWFLLLNISFVLVSIVNKPTRMSPKIPVISLD